jgi:hypothetical protein
VADQASAGVEVPEEKLAPVSLYLGREEERGGAPLLPARPSAAAMQYSIRTRGRRRGVTRGRTAAGGCGQR